jgi:DNA-binding IclR family transcriptional regulator
MPFEGGVKVNRKILRALCRFDVANVEEIADVCGCNKASARQYLNGLVAEGHADRLGENYIRYFVTSAGREEARKQ